MPTLQRMLQSESQYKSLRALLFCTFLCYNYTDLGGLTMNLEKLIKLSDDYTDEALTKAQTINFANKALAVINSKLRTELPYFADVITNYTALTDTWLMTLILPYLNYSIKMNDSSIVEASRYENEFYAALATFETQFTETLDAAYTANVTGGIYRGSPRNSNSGWFHGAQ